MGPLILALVLGSAAPDAAMPAPPVPDAVLAALRGGFRLPSGIDVSLAVQTDTSVNGALLLRSVFSASEGRPTLQVLAPEPGRIVSGPQHGASASGGGAASGIAVQFDRQAGVTLVPSGNVMPVVSVTTGAIATAADAAAAGLGTVDVTAGSSAVETPGGAVSIMALPDGARVRLEGSGLDISHVVGNAFGSVIANNANDRVIDTATTINLDLGNAGPDVLGSAMFRVEGIAVDAARLGVR